MIYEHGHEHEATLSNNIFMLASNSGDKGFIAFLHARFFQKFWDASYIEEVISIGCNVAFFKFILRIIASLLFSKF